MGLDKLLKPLRYDKMIENTEVETFLYKCFAGAVPCRSIGIYYGRPGMYEAGLEMVNASCIVRNKAGQLFIKSGDGTAFVMVPDRMNMQRDESPKPEITFYNMDECNYFLIKVRMEE